MRLNDLERLLASIPPHPRPKVELEQYATPADVAAPLLFEARALGDVVGRAVVDLGCGTGVLGIGAALLGAASVVGVDVDGDAVEVARAAAARLGAPCEFRVGDVAAWSGRADTVLMNPPFGAQRRGADRPFLDAAFRSADVVFCLANAPARAWTEAYAAGAGFGATHRWRLAFTLRHQYRHHSRAAVETEVVAIRFQRNASPAQA